MPCMGCRQRKVKRGTKRVGEGWAVAAGPSIVLVKAVERALHSIDHSTATRHANAQSSTDQQADAADQRAHMGRSRAIGHGQRAHITEVMRWLCRAD